MPVNAMYDPYAAERNAMNPAALRRIVGAPTVDARVNELFGMQPGMDRLNFLPRYDSRQGWIAPNALYQVARALVSPGVAAQGGNVSPEDAVNFGGVVGSGGIGASALMRNPAPGPGRTVAQTVYHSSPHSFDKFDISKIGTGDGTQGFGHGVYVAESPSVGGKGGAYYRQFTSQHGKANAYQVDIPDETIGKMMDWDAPVTVDSPQNVKDALNAVAKKFPGIRDEYHQAVRDGRPGWWYYSRLSDEMGKSRPSNFKGDALAYNQKAASETLRDAGLPGMKYLDGESRNAGQGTRNYVVFDDKLLKILSKE